MRESSPVRKNKKTTTQYCFKDIYNYALLYIDAVTWPEITMEKIEEGFYNEYV